MITRIKGKLVEKKEQALVIENNGFHYEILVPSSVIRRIDEIKSEAGEVSLITYHYLQVGQSSTVPILVGFLSEIEKDFFLQFITVSGIGPKAAIKALNKPIPEITRAIDSGDLGYLKTLPGIGMQRAKEIIAKLQGKVGKFGLIKDQPPEAFKDDFAQDIKEEALSVLLQLQYKKQEALNMILKALERSNSISTSEELLNEIYKQ
ncbi:MAG: Holliday junction DNA helicase RuvA, partial [Candidatus Omnitrophica bacterium]|nr:Holliday junction DNA helicase RuvA [Candidatus Omnitrophota bacterium]